MMDNGRSEPEFNPRRAALRHAANVERAADGSGAPGKGREMIMACEAINALACGLVYIGDQLLRQNGLIGALHVDGETGEEIAERVREALWSRDG